MSILSGAIGTMKKKATSWTQYQVPNTYNTKTYWVTGLGSEPSAGASGLQWKTTNTATTGTGSYTDGLANSNAMNNATHPAAFYCRGLTLGSYTWFLPSAGELNHIYTNLSASGKLLAPSGSHADKFTGASYFSSSEYPGDGRYAQIQVMTTGFQSFGQKQGILRVRACRKV